MSTRNPWSVLGIDRSTDETLIRRAYARALKAANPEEDAAAFARVRAAYEAALAHARRGATRRSASAPAPAPAAVPAAVPAPAPATVSAPAPPAQQQAVIPASAPDSDSPPGLQALADAFKSLRQAVKAAGATPQALVDRLDDCLKSQALEHVQTRLQFEAALARWLCTHRDLPGVPMMHAIERLKWRSTGRVRQQPDIAELLRHADFLQWMQSPDFHERPVFRALSKPPRFAWLWWNIFVFRIDRLVREAIARQAIAGNMLPTGWNPAAVAWWRSHFSRPQPRTGLMHLTWVLALLGFFAALNTGMDDGRSLRIGLFPLAGLVLGVAVTAGWYLGVDLPLSRRAGGARTPRGWLRFGWGPAALATCLVAGVLPDRGYSTALVGMLVALAIAWCYWAMRMTSRDGRLGLTSQRLLGHIVLNVPLGVWLCLMSGRAELQPTMAMLLATAGCALLLLLGQRLLSLEDGKPGHESLLFRGPIGVLGIAVLLMALLPGVPITPRGVHMMLMAIVAAIMAQRVLAVEMLTGAQLKMRYYFTTLPMSALAPGMLIDNTSTRFLFRGLGAAFLGGILVTTIVCLHGQWRRRKPRGILS